jgi:hypothetical protein
MAFSAVFPIHMLIQTKTANEGAISSDNGTAYSPDQTFLRLFPKFHFTYEY